MTTPLFKVWYRNAGSPLESGPAKVRADTAEAAMVALRERFGDVTPTRAEAVPERAARSYDAEATLRSLDWLDGPTTSRTLAKATA